MSWNDIMRRVLAPAENGKRRWNVRPDVKSPYGDTNRPPGSSNPHGGVDFNHIGDDAGRFNKSYPAIRAPVNGVVTNAGHGNYGTIAIRDANGFSHEILHTHSRHVAVGDRVIAGQLIGTMGDTGVVGSTPSNRRDHVHYQLKDPAGNRVNPTEYWNQQGPIDPNPPPPAYLREYQEYLNTPGAVGSHQSPEDRSNFRQLIRVEPKADLGGYDPNAPATVPNQIPAPGASSFDDRFGSWTSSPSGSAPVGPNQPVAPPQPGRRLGIVSGQPMPDIPLPPQIFGFADPSQTPGYEDWSLQRLKPPNWPKR